MKKRFSECISEMFRPVLRSFRHHKRRKSSLVYMSDQIPKWEDDKCFVATAACDDRNPLNLTPLYRFRDEYLLRRRLGRFFVAVYLRCSPPLAAIIHSRPLLRLLTRAWLVPLIKFLEFAGYR